MAEQQQARFEATWKSLANFTIPQWYQDAKFGIFIHWGIFSVPAFDNEWYSRNMYLQGTRAFEHHRQTWGDQAKFGYKDFIPLFKGEKFNADEWLDLFQQAGAKYIVPVAEHHDGFAMYDSALSAWTAAKMGPKRDVLGELAAAARQRSITFGLSNHRAEHWWFMNGGLDYPSDVQDPTYADFYGPAMPGPKTWEDPVWETADWQPRPDGKYLEDWLARNCELVDKYQPQLIYFDWWIRQTVFAPYVQRFAAYYYNRGVEWGKGVAIDFKYDTFPEGTAVFDVERGQLKDIRPQFWQTDTSVSKNSWGYIEHHDYKDASTILHDLIDVVSKNAALLLNVGPRADGSIPEPEQDILRFIGRWLAVNGEAIYSTRPWKVFGEGPTEVAEGMFTDTKRAAFTAQDVRFTTKDDVLYAIALGTPADGKLAIQSLGTNANLQQAPINRVSLLGSDASLQWTREADGLHIVLPERVRTAQQPALTFKIE